MTLGEGHDYPPGRRSHQQVTQAPTPGRLRLTTKPCSGCSSIKTATPTSGPLGEFLAQDEVRVMMLDPACTKPLTFREFVKGRTHSPSRLRSRTPTTGLVHQPRRTMAPSTTSLHRRTPSPPPALGHPSRPPTGCRSSHPNLSALGTEPTEPSRMPASRAAPRSPAETGSARRVAARRR